MEIKYDSNSFKSILIKKLIKLSGFKKNTNTLENTKNYINKCSKRKINENLFNGMIKTKTEDYIFYKWNNKKNIKSVILYIHGGSFVDKPLNIQINFIKKLSEELNTDLIIPIYKTIPEGTGIQFYQEMLLIYNLLIKKYKKIYLVGDSAGGGAALSLNMLINEEKLPSPEAVIMLSPWLDISLTNKKIDNIKDIVCSKTGNIYCGQLWKDTLDEKDYKVSPLYGNVNKLNKVFIACSKNEICNPDCINLVDKLKKESINYKYVEFTKQFHNFELYPIKESKIVINEISKFIKENK